MSNFILYVDVFVDGDVRRVCTLTSDRGGHPIAAGPRIASCFMYDRHNYRIDPAIGGLDLVNVAVEHAINFPKNVPGIKFELNLPFADAIKYDYVYIVTVNDIGVRMSAYGKDLEIVDKDLIHFCNIVDTEPGLQSIVYQED